MIDFPICMYIYMLIVFLTSSFLLVLLFIQLLLRRSSSTTIKYKGVTTAPQHPNLCKGAEVLKGAGKVLIGCRGAEGYC